MRRERAGLSPTWFKEFEPWVPVALETLLKYANEHKCDTVAPAP